MDGYTDIKTIRQGVAELDKVLELRIGRKVLAKARVQVHADTNYSEQSSAKISTLIDGQWNVLLTLINAIVVDGYAYHQAEAACKDASSLLVARATELLS